MTPTDADALDALIADYLQAVEQGSAPDPAEWIARHPQHAADLAAFLADLTRFGPLLNLTPAYRPGDETIDYRRSDADEGERFGNYELLGEIGRGAMGVVYRARPAGANLIVALKRVRPGGPDDREAARCFREEVEAASSLRHPNIVPVYHVAEDDDGPFYTMALVEGGSLDQHLARLRNDHRAAAVLVAKVARAVHYAHQRRILHRDLKPSNILLDEAGEPHVADFGLATRLTSAGAADGGSIAGSLPWMAPEAVRAAQVLTTAVDVWALGVILYEVLTGHRPFTGRDRAELTTAILEREPTHPRDLNRHLSRDLDAVCRRCLAKDPDRRYESAVAIALELDRWLRDEPVRARPPARGERLARWFRRNPVSAAGTIVVAGLLVATTAASLSVEAVQEQRLAEEVGRSNKFAAGQVALRVRGQLRLYQDAVKKIGASPELARLIAQGDRAAESAFLEKERAAYNAAPDRGLARADAMPALTSLFRVDATAAIVAYAPPRNDVPGVHYRGRDYFNGARAAPGRAHVSRVFKSVTDHLSKFAITVALPPLADGSDAGVLAATITTDVTLGLDRLQDDTRSAVLLAPHDDAPYDGPPSPAGSPPERYLILLHPPYETGDRPRDFDRVLPDLRGVGVDIDYRDPFAEAGPDGAAPHPEYAGRWVAGFAPVEGTEMIVLVQQPYEASVAPHRAFARQLLSWIGGAFGVGAVLMALLWTIRRLLVRPSP